MRGRRLDGVPPRIVVVAAVTLLLSTLSLKPVESVSHRSSSPAVRCELITDAHCRSMPYNLTRFPNLAGDETARHAAETLASFDPLLTYACSPHLHFFLCSVYFPMCNDKVDMPPIGPCRPLCEQVRAGCEPVMQTYNFPWPDTLNCSRFPAANVAGGAMCMRGQGMLEGDDEEEDVERKSGTSADETGRGSQQQQPQPQSPSTGSRQCGPREVYASRALSCVPLCSSPPSSASSSSLSDTDYSSGRRGWPLAETAEQVLLVGVLLLLSIIALLLYAILLTRDRRRRLPSSSSSSSSSSVSSDRALLFSSISFVSSGVALFVSLLYRHEISCLWWGGGAWRVWAVSPALWHPHCALSASLLYYFGTAGRLWAVVFALFHYYLSRHHGSSPSEVWWARMQICGWLTPCLLVMVALMSRSVAAEPDSGLCLLGHTDSTRWLIFVGLRELVLGALAVCPLLAACIYSGPSSSSSSFSSSSSSCTRHVFSLGWWRVVAAWLYPVAASLLLIVYVQTANSQDRNGDRQFQVKRWSALTTIRVLSDSVLGLLSALLLVLRHLSCGGGGGGSNQLRDGDDWKGRTAYEPAPSCAPPRSSLISAPPLPLGPPPSRVTTSNNTTTYYARHS